MLRNYVRNNALCIIAADFDAKLCKIRWVLPVDDATNKYMQQSVQDLKDRLNEIERKIAALQNNVQIMLNLKKWFEKCIVLNNYPQYLRNVCWLMNYTFRREEIFREDMSQYNDLWQMDVVEMRAYMRFNRSYYYILTVIDVLSKYAWAESL